MEKSVAHCIEKRTDERHRIQRSTYAAPEEYSADDRPGLPKVGSGVVYRRSLGERNPDLQKAVGDLKGKAASTGQVEAPLRQVC